VIALILDLEREPAKSGETYVFTARESGPNTKRLKDFRVNFVGYTITAIGGRPKPLFIFESFQGTPRGVAADIQVLRKCAYCGE
jgi:hypothetical protein